MEERLFGTVFGPYLGECENFGDLLTGVVEEMTVRHTDYYLHMVLSLPHFVPAERLFAAERALEMCLHLHTVVIMPRYPADALDAATIPSVVQYLKRYDLAVNGTFDDATYDLTDGVLTVRLAHGGKNILETTRADKTLRDLIERQFNVSLQVNICGEATLCEDEHLRQMRERGEQEAAALERERLAAAREAAQKAAERAKKKPAKQVSAREKLLQAAEAKLKEQEKEDKQLSVNADESMQGQLLGRKNQRKMHREALKAISKPSGWGPLTAVLNSQSQGTHDDRHGVYYEGEPPVKRQKEFEEVSGTRPEATEVRTEQGMLRGATYTPEGYENNQPQKVVLFFSGSGGPSEEQSANAIQTHLENGAKVVCLNYRGYGKSETLDANGKKKGTSLSEKSLYDDGMAMYEYVTKPKEEGGLGYAPEDVVLHGYSMGGAVASRVAAEVSQMNIARAIAKNEPLEQSNKLGGLIMQSPMPSMRQAATLQAGSFAGLVASSSGGYNSIENTKLARQYDPDLPIHVIGGARENHVILNEKENTPTVLEGDWLNPKISGYMDGIKGLKNVTYAEGKGDHFGKNVANESAAR